MAMSGQIHAPAVYARDMSPCVTVRMVNRPLRTDDMGWSYTLWWLAGRLTAVVLMTQQGCPFRRTSVHAVCVWLCCFLSLVSPVVWFGCVVCRMTRNSTELVRCRESNKEQKQTNTQTIDNL
jgi:hypothetical protein